MNKDTTFIGQPIFLQLIKFIPRNIIRKKEHEHSTNRYIKKFDGYNHLVTLLFSILSRCDSLREVSSGMLSQANKLSHLGIDYIARRSTLSDANARRDSKFFADIYYSLCAKYLPFLSDSQPRKSKYRFKIIDSSTITLFKELLKATSMANKSGKRKGGMKVHTLMDSHSSIPIVVNFTAAAENDIDFLSNLNDEHLAKDSVLVFDKGYISYYMYEQLSLRGVTYVTKRINRAKFRLINERCGTVESPLIVCDQIVEFTKKADYNKGTPKITHRARCIVYKESEHSEELIFQTNNFKIPAMDVVELYHQRWQIELLFKQLKQNFELKYFLGDNVNAIESQVWVALIANLLVSVVKAQVKRRCSFTGIVSLLRIHLMNYISMIKLLETPDTMWIKSDQTPQKIPELPFITS